MQEGVPGVKGWSIWGKGRWRRGEWGLRGWGVSLAERRGRAARTVAGIASRKNSSALYSEMLKTMIAMMMVVATVMWKLFDILVFWDGVCFFRVNLWWWEARECVLIHTVSDHAALLCWLQHVAVLISWFPNFLCCVSRVNYYCSIPIQTKNWSSLKLNESDFFIFKIN